MVKNYIGNNKCLVFQMTYQKDDNFLQSSRNFECKKSAVLENVYTHYLIFKNCQKVLKILEKI